MSLHKIGLYELGERVSADELADRVANVVGPLTRVVALTWVHSSTGGLFPSRTGRAAAPLSTLALAARRG